MSLSNIDWAPVHDTDKAEITVTSKCPGFQFGYDSPAKFLRLLEQGPHL